MTSITLPDGHTDSFSYNGLGMRLTKSDPTGSYSYLNDGFSPASDVLTDGYSTFTPGISETKGAAGGGYASEFYLADASGNSRGLLNGSDAATDGYNWDAFGNLVSRFGSNPTGFAWNVDDGYQTDNDDGLTLLGYRYYDSRIGRFISQDPAGDGDNWYGYAGNDPMNKTDPTGLSDGLPGSLGAPDQRYGGLGGFLDGGGMSSLDGFWSSENDSEQRGYAAYLAAGEVTTAYIDPRFSASDQSAIKNALYLIASTARGSEIMGAAYFSGNYIDVLDLAFSKDPDINIQPGLTFGLGSGTIGFNPDSLNYFQLKREDGYDNPTILVSVAHELGHALTGIADSGPNHNDNVNANENPIVTQLGVSARTNYNLSRVLSNPYGIDPGFYDNGTRVGP